MLEVALMGETARIEFVLDNSHLAREFLEALPRPEMGAFIRERLVPLKIRVRREGLREESNALNKIWHLAHGGDSPVSVPFGQAQP